MAPETKSSLRSLRSRVLRTGLWLATHFGGTAGTQPDDREMDEARAVAKLARDQLTHRVKLLGEHGSVVGAALACEVLPLTGHGERVEPRAVPEVHVAN